VIILVLVCGLISVGGVLVLVCCWVVFLMVKLIGICMILMLLSYECVGVVLDVDFSMVICRLVWVRVSVFFFICVLVVMLLVMIIMMCVVLLFMGSRICYGGVDYVVCYIWLACGVGEMVVVD